MTNGEKFKEVFKISQVDDCDLNIYVWLPIHDAIEIPLEWWNAEYEEPTTKNDSEHNLCDSCINYKCEFQSGIVRTKCAFYMPPQHSSGLEKNSKKLEKDFGELDCISRADAIRVASGYCHPSNVAKELAKLSSVTPIRPKGQWKLVQRGKSIDVCCSNCEAVRIKGYAYNYTIDQLDKEDLKECFECADMRFCPNCGSDNREVEK